MNININDVLKSADTKFMPKSESRDDKGESFIKSFNKLLETKRLNHKKQLKDKQNQRSQGMKEKEKPEDLREFLNTNYLIQSNYQEEKTLNSEMTINSIEDILIGDGETLGELFQDENFNFDDFNSELGELLKTNTDGEFIESLLDFEGDEALKVNNQNFSLEEAKANLARALNVEVNTLNIENKLNIETSEDNKGLENYKNLENIIALEQDNTIEDTEALEVKGQLVDKANLIEKLEKNSFDVKVSVPAIKLENLDEVKEEFIDNLDLEDLNAIEEDETIVKTTEGNTDLGEAKIVDPNLLFNRIQSSMIGLEEAEDLDIQNIQTIEDSMIKFMKVSKEGDVSVMRVRLYPEELGSIDISLKFDKGKLIADIIVASENIKEMFLNSSSILNKNLIEQNVPVKNINIKVQDTFDNLETFNGETKDGESSKNNGQGQQARRNRGNNLNNSPIDSMRIENINKRNISNEGLNILV